MSEKCKCTSPSAIQLKNWRTTICTKEKLNVISQLDKGYIIVDIRHNVIVTHRRLRTIHDNAYGFTESAKSVPKFFV